MERSEHARPHRRPGRLFTALALTLVVLGGCLPYTVGSTAATVPPGEQTSAAIAYVIPYGAAPLNADSGQNSAFVGLDAEFRWGLTQQSDIGVRVPGLSGVVVNYKRLLTRRDEQGDEPNRTLVSVMPGVGLLHWGEHAHFELSLLASAPPGRTWTPYGGLRAMQVLPLSDVAVSDSPTLGGFIGTRIGSEQRGVSPELGIYYDDSALEIRDSDVIFVLGVAVHGVNVFSALLEAMSPPRGW